MIRCCKGCVAPKRHVGCHSKCKDYADEKAKDNERKAKAETERQLNIACIERIQKVKDEKAKRWRSSGGYHKFGRG